MDSRLDLGRFETLCFVELGEYVDEIEAHGFPARADETQVSMLLRNIGRYDDVRGIYIIRWAIRLQLRGVCNMTIRFLRERQLGPGAQLSVVWMLGAATELKEQHIASIESLRTAVDAETWGDSIEKLRQSIKQNDRRRQL